MPLPRHRLRGPGFVFTFFGLGCFAACAARPPAVVYQTDFGLADGAVAAMKGVALGVDANLTLVDLTHEIPPFDIWQAAYRLHQTAPFWPAGTVFVSVVDPGVGTDRRAVVGRDRDGRLYVTPDNGTLTLLTRELDAARVLDTTRFRRSGSETSHTFHGRDVFSFVAAQLAAKRLEFTTIGDAAPVASLVCLDVPGTSVRTVAARLEATGFVPVLDVQYGNVWTNLDPTTLREAGIDIGDRIAVRISNGARQVFAGEMPFVRTFGDVREGEPLAYTNSLGNLAFALNLGSFAAKHGISAGPQWTVVVSAM